MAELFGPGLKAKLLGDANLPEVQDEARLLQEVRDKLGPYASADKVLWHLRACRGKVHWAVNSYLRAVLSTVSSGEDFDPAPPCAAHQPLQQPAASCQQGHASNPNPLQSTDLQERQQQLQQQQQQQEQAVPPAAADAQDASTGSVTSSSYTSSMETGQEVLAAHAATATAAAAATVPVQLDGLPADVLGRLLSYLDLPSLLNAACSCQRLLKAAQGEGLWRTLFQQRWGAVVFPVDSCCSSSGHAAAAGTSAVAHGGSDPPAGFERAAAAGAAVGCVNGTGAGGVKGTGAGGRAEWWRWWLGVQSSAGRQAQQPSGSVQSALQLQQHQQQQQQQQQPQQQQLQQPSQHHQQQQQQQQEGRGEGFASRSMGSSCTSSRSALQQQQQHDGMPPPAPQPPRMQQGSSKPAHAPLPAATTTEQQQQLPLAAPCGSWQRQFKQQYSYQVLRLCPRCGTSSIIPIVYGFPSTGLVSGMQAKRLVLGGDHLIESCHTWTCGSCRSCFRFYPYVNVQLWLQDDAAQQRRVAAQRGRAGDEPAGGDGGGGQEQQQGADGSAGSHADADVFPQYTYEL